MTLFDNGNSDEFLLLVQNFIMMFKYLVTISDIANLQYHRTLLCGEALRQFDALSTQVGNTNTTTLNQIFLV